MPVLVVTGTAAGVGKTVTVAALARCATGSVAVVKLAQVGLPDTADGDVSVVGRLARGTAVHEFARYPDALPPHLAAPLAGRLPLVFSDVVRRLVDLDAEHDLVVVEGTGGLLVPFDAADRWTLIDLGHALDARVLVVVGTGSDSCDHAALTIAAIEEQGLTPAGVVIGSWPAEPELAARHAVADLRRLAPGGLAGVLPAGLPAAKDFTRRARASLTREWGGTFDARGFAARQQP